MVSFTGYSAAAMSATATNAITLANAPMYCRLALFFLMLRAIPQNKLTTNAKKMRKPKKAKTPSTVTVLT